MSSEVETSLTAMSEERKTRKTPEMRAQMTNIERLRHSTAHVLAMAILVILTGAKDLPIGL
jgi:threonyl-tRNA synthetase